MQTIGFIGLGNMGYPMACHLLKAGYTVLGLDCEKSARLRFESNGGKSTDLPSDLLQADAIITMLNTGAQVAAICLGEGGLYECLSKHKLHIDCSTVSPNVSQTLALQAKKHELFMIDAPVSGGMEGAKNGTLTFMVGGEEKALEKARPLLLAMGQNIWHMGKASTGSIAKLCNNLLLGITMIGTSEALLLAKRLNLDPNLFCKLLNQSSGQNWVTSHYVPLPNILPNVPANRNYEPGFSSAMMLKDLSLAEDMAHQVKLDTPLAKNTLALYKAYCDAGNSERDFSSIIQYIATEESS